MKTNRFQFEYRKSASKLHRAVGDCLRDSDLFRHYEIYQEYPVVKVNTTYSESSHHFDWVIIELKVVIECHGRQHYKVVAFDGDVEKAVLQFSDLKGRDRAKRRAAMSAGWAYVEIPYNVKNISDSLISELIKVGREETEKYNKNNGTDTSDAETIRSTQKKEYEKERRREYLASEQHQDELRRAREYRRERYRQLKSRSS